MMNPLTVSMVMQHQEQMRAQARRNRPSARVARGRRTAGRFGPLLHLRHGTSADGVAEPRVAV